MFDSFKMLFTKLRILTFQISICLVQSLIIPSSCPVGEKFSQCPKTNEPTCKVKIASRSLSCSARCTCANELFVRNDAGICIPVWECPDICPPNSKFSFCVNIYKQLCISDVPLEEKIKEPCKPGCSCIAGHVWVSNYSKCVTKRSCRLNYMRDYILRLG